MANEEKAREIGLAIGKGVVDVVIATAGAAEMAEWKDQQFREYLEKKRNEYLSQRDCANMYSEQWAVFHALACTMNKILQERFPNDKEQN